MKKLVKFLVWEAVLLTGVYLVKNYGKQCENYWDLFKEACKDDEVKKDVESNNYSDVKTEDSTLKTEVAKVEEPLSSSSPVETQANKEEKAVSKTRIPRVKKVTTETTDIKKEPSEKKVKPRAKIVKKTE